MYICVCVFMCVHTYNGIGGTITLLWASVENIGQLEWGIFIYMCVCVYNIYLYKLYM